MNIKIGANRYQESIFALLCSGIVILWSYHFNGRFDSWSALFDLIIIYSSISLGDIIFRFIGNGIIQEVGVSLKLVSGFISISAIFLYVKFLIPHFSDIIFLASCGLINCIKFFRRETEVHCLKKPVLQNIAVLLLCGLFTTLWCHDSFKHPFYSQGNNQVEIPLWRDCFYHMRMISSIGQVGQINDISNIVMQGAKVPPYHYASYIIPSLMYSIVKINSYDAYVNFLLPFGLLLSGLSAYCLIASLYGPWSGVFSACILFILPDGYFQGFHNKFLSYHFLQQVGPSALYGISCLSIGWICIIRGCVTNQLRPVLFGWIFIGLCIMFKAQLFVASSLVGIVYPILFLNSIKRRNKCIYIPTVLVVFTTVLAVTNNSSYLPRIVPNFTSMHAYASILVNSCDPGTILKYVKTLMDYASGNSFGYGLSLVVLIIFQTFGIYLLLYILFSFVFKNVENKVKLLFPLFITTNYLIMSIALAFDTHSIGMPEELLHRPFVWAYFSVITCTAGLFYKYFITNLSNLKKHLIYLCFISYGVYSISYYSKGIQTMPSWGSSNSIDCGLWQVVNYLKYHKKTGDLVLMSSEDDRCIVSGFAEIQYYLAKTDSSIRLPNGYKNRLEDIKCIEKEISSETIKKYIIKNNIAWYILNTDDHVAWPLSFIENYTYSCGKYRLYKFNNPS